MDNPQPQDQIDFSRARAKHFLRAVWGILSGHRCRLMSWDEVRDKLKLRGLVARGVHTVPLDKIVGSVGRYQDFDDAFLPRTGALSARWRKINRAFHDEISLPPVKLYKVGDVYFVLDGNHRVSVARERGAEFIDAEVLDAVTRVPVTTQDIDADALIILGEYAEFLERTRLDVLRPQQNIRFSIGGGYARLIEHIAAHRYFMGLEQQREISEDEAVMDWYDTVYLPIVCAIREQDVLKHFPGRTEADLYLWVSDHYYYLKETYGHDVSPEEAVADYQELFGVKSPIEKVQGALEHVANMIAGRGEDEPPEAIALNQVL
ncbi:MAG: DUF4032 domain-containing protein [Anaerolineae bacterium]|nr:DUF4032 domain-containing protein [Thermoflexales bacterium]MDW8407173.1 DUF4032 domain-containing protein [Anaerolineae bacterium]